MSPWVLKCALWALTRTNTHTHTKERARTCNWPLTNASGCFIFPLLQHRPSQKTPELSLCLSMCQKERQRKKEREISKTDDLKAPHDHFLSVIHKAAFTLSFHPPHLPYIYIHTHSHTHPHRQSGADILGGVIPGVESSRSPCCDPVILGRGRVLDACRERKRLYQKHISPRGCIIAATWIRRDVHLCTHMHRNSYWYVIRSESFTVHIACTKPGKWQLVQNFKHKAVVSGQYDKISYSYMWLTDSSNLMWVSRTQKYNTGHTTKHYIYTLILNQPLNTVLMQRISCNSNHQNIKLFAFQYHIVRQSICY